MDDRGEVSAGVDQVRICLESARRNSIVTLGTVLGIAAVTMFAYITGSLALNDYFAAALLTFCLALVGATVVFRHRSVRLTRFHEFERDTFAALKLPTSAGISDEIQTLERRAEDHAELQTVLAAWMPKLQLTLDSLLGRETKRARAARVVQLCEEADRIVKAAIQVRHEALPQVNARNRIEVAIAHLRQLVSEADRQFDQALDKATLKWWHQLTRDRGPLVEIENQIAALEAALSALKSSPDLVAAEADYLELQNIVDRRIAVARRAAADAIPGNHRLAYDPDHALSVGMIVGAASMPISIAADVYQAGSIYDALREVNGNFAEMNDLQIWHETLSMPAESLVGLASLTKGAYFEQLIERDFGGERFVNFNHPDTDIVIDGVAYQIKATDSVSYVESVADHIPVIATSEVAEQTGAIDGGLTDVDLSGTIELALGGTVIDFGDTILDGLSTGLGGIGIVAILRGTHSAWQECTASGNAAEALGVGLKATAMNTARSLVTIAEVVVRGTTAVVTSRPMKSIGRKLLEASTSARPQVAH